jgi:hypothetical protein
MTPENSIEKNCEYCQFGERHDPRGIYPAGCRLSPSVVEKNDIERIKERIIVAIRDTYPEDVWLPVPKEMRAKDAVAAQLLRDMAPAMASIACEVFTTLIQSQIQAIEGRKIVLREESDHLPNVYKHLKGKNEAFDDVITILKGYTGGV